MRTFWLLLVVSTSRIWRLGLIATGAAWIPMAPRNQAEKMHNRRLNRTKDFISYSNQPRRYVKVNPGDAGGDKPRHISLPGPSCCHRSSSAPGARKGVL